MNKSKLIFLYGFASGGKTTLSKKYISEHKLALSIEGDQIISMMGQWREHENEAREIVFEHTCAMVRQHLEKGYDVLLPYLLTNPNHPDIFENIALEAGADFHEVYIEIDRDDAVQRLLQRGVWGEEGSPKLSESDLPEINDLYDNMEQAMASRKSVKSISSELGDIDGTYAKLLDAIL